MTFGAAQFRLWFPSSVGHAYISLPRLPYSPPALPLPPPTAHYPHPHPTGCYRLPLVPLDSPTPPTLDTPSWCSGYLWGHLLPFLPSAFRLPTALPTCLLPAICALYTPPCHTPQHYPHCSLLLFNYWVGPLNLVFLGHGASWLLPRFPCPYHITLPISQPCLHSVLGIGKANLMHFSGVSMVALYVHASSQW